MGFRFRKSFGAGPFRVNLSKSGIGYSVGTKGIRYTKKAVGGTRTTASIPGTGISYVKESGIRENSSASTHSRTTQENLQQPSSPQQTSEITLTTVLLAWFLGMFGAHKFQQRKYGIGILYLFTCGLLCVGWLGDAIQLTFRYSAQKKGTVPTNPQKYVPYVVVALLVVLGSCTNGGSQPFVETTPTTIPESTVAISETTVPEKTETVIETTEIVTKPNETVIETTESVVDTTATVAESTVQPTEPTEEMVWIPTGGGTKYHSRSSCSNMDNPSHVPLSTAISRGFTPCKRCH